MIHSVREKATLIFFYIRIETYSTLYSVNATHKHPTNSNIYNNDMEKL